MPDYACPQDWVYRYIANHASVWIDLYTEPLPRVEVFFISEESAQTLDHSSLTQVLANELILGG